MELAPASPRAWAKPPAHTGEVWPLVGGFQSPYPSSDLAEARMCPRKSRCRLHPWPWLEPGCPGAGGLSSVTVLPVLVWCPQHGLLSGTGEGPEPSGGGRTAEGPEVSVLSEGWRSHTRGRPDPLPPRAPHPPTAGPGAHNAGPWSVGVWTLLGISLLATPLVHLTAGAPRCPWSLCPLSPGWRLP